MEATTVAFLLLPNVHLQDIAGPAQVFYEASMLGSRQFKTIYISTQSTVQSAQGLTFSCQTDLPSISLKKGDVICIPGVDFEGFTKGSLDEITATLAPWLREQYAKGVFMATICSGALVLGRAGLLDNMHCTSHWKCLPYMKAQFPKAKVLDNRLYVFDKGIFTSAGMTTGIDMTLALVEKWCNPLLSAKVAQEMVINVRRPETKSQQNIFLDFKNHFNPDVYKAQEILADRLDVDFTIGDLAKMLNMSTRHLARLFKSHTGQTLQQYRDQIRLAHGEQLLLHTERSVKEIAVACGFSDARQFSRLWKQKKGAAPAAFKKQAGAAPEGS